MTDILQLCDGLSQPTVPVPRHAGSRQEQRDVSRFTANHRTLGKTADSAHAALMSATKQTVVANIRIVRRPQPWSGYTTV